MSRRLAPVAAMTVGLAAAPAWAESPTVPKPLSQEWAGDLPRVVDTCEPANDRYAVAPLFRIVSAKATDRVHLFAKKLACADGARCPHRRRAYLVPGDVVLGGPEDRGFRCAYFGSSRGELVTGFVPAGTLAPVEAETALTRAFLLGAWRRDSASRLRIGPNGSAGIEVDGGGHWRGTHSVNEGQFNVRLDAVASPILVLRKETDGCTVVIERRGPYLLLNDNARCGGHNVRFVGIYIRHVSRRARAGRGAAMRPFPSAADALISSGRQTGALRWDSW